MSSTAFDDQWSVEPLPNGDFQVIYPNSPTDPTKGLELGKLHVDPDWEERQNTITFQAGNPSVEMLKVSPKGFWVRGVKVPQDDREAETVYNAFKSWMVWAEMNRR
jgi:hypothetical protein